MGFLGVFLGAVFVQAGALVAEFSPKTEESLNMAFFDSVIDFSFPVMPLIAAYLATFGLKTPFLMLRSLVALSSLIFPRIEEPNGAKVARKKRASTFIFAPKCRKNYREQEFFKIGALPKMGRILRVSPQFIRYI